MLKDHDIYVYDATSASGLVLDVGPLAHDVATKQASLLSLCLTVGADRDAADTAALLARSLLPALAIRLPMLLKDGFHAAQAHRVA